MSLWYRIAKNYTLPISAVVLVLSIIGLAVSLGLLGYVANDLNTSIMTTLGAWALWVTILSGLGLLIGGWYVAEQLWFRRKFERLLDTEKRTEFMDNRKRLDDLAKRLPDTYKPRIKEKEAQFLASKRA